MSERVRTLPLYEYRCKQCGHVFEKIQSFSAPDVKECPRCAGEVERLISAPAIQFKGSGFYLTDYGKTGGASKGASESGASESKPGSESKSSGNSDASSSGAASPGGASGASSTPASNSGSSSGSGSTTGSSSSPSSGSSKG